MYAVVPFQITDEAGSWGSPSAAVVEAETFEESVEKFIAACVYPHADTEVWGDAADQGSSPENAGDYHYYIVYDDDEEAVTIDLSIMEKRVKLFEDYDDAEEYRDTDIRTLSWAYDDREIEDEPG